VCSSDLAVGTVYLQLDGKDVASFPLVTLQDVAEGSWWKQFTDWVAQQFSDEA
jgi:D-alanyl-D-alanine carboxypeptidase (penicillin-binding protein 5/6)